MPVVNRTAHSPSGRWAMITPRVPRRILCRTRPPRRRPAATRSPIATGSTRSHVPAIPGESLLWRFERVHGIGVRRLVRMTHTAHGRFGSSPKSTLCTRRAGISPIAPLLPLGGGAFSHSIPVRGRCPGPRRAAALAGGSVVPDLRTCLARTGLENMAFASVGDLVPRETDVQLAVQTPARAISSSALSLTSTAMATLTAIPTPGRPGARLEAAACATDSRRSIGPLHSTA